MSREVLVSNMPNTKGKIIAEGPIGKEWGKEEVNTKKFVIMILDDDKIELQAQLETSKILLGEPDAEGVPTVVKESVPRYSFSESKVDEILAGKKTISVTDILDNLK